MFKFFESLLGGNSSETSPVEVAQKQINAREQIALENRKKYGQSYDIVNEFDSTMAYCLVREGASKYAMDWLAESIQKGIQVEYSAVIYSREKGMPYVCDTEEETWVFDREEDPLKDSVAGIYNAILYYACGKDKGSNENKYNYWLNRLLSFANNGDFMAKGLLCWKCGVIRIDGTYDGVIARELWEQLKCEYEESIINACDAGNPYAQLTVANYGREVSDAEREELYLLAIEKGLTDACYYYAKFLSQKKFAANGYMIPSYGTAEWQEYMYDELSLYKKGAELDNGVFAGYCQYQLGDMYADGDGGVFKDPITAQIWFKKAFSNGYEKAEHRINA